MATQMAEKKKIGRPSDYKPEYCDLVIELGQKGYSVVMMAAQIGVLRSTLYRWADTFPEFCDSLKRAQEEGEAFMEAQGIQAMWADKFNTGPWALIMKNRYGWRDKQELSSDKDAPLLPVINVTTK